MVRNHHGNCWSSSIMDIRPSSELASLRSLNDGRPGTRAQPGFCAMRWTDGVKVAFQFLNENFALPESLGFANFEERVLAEL